MDRHQCTMLKKLMEISFCLCDIDLYLDTHPKDERALKIHNSLSKEHNHLESKYTKMYGPLKTSDISHDYWNYLSSPWPWDFEF